MIGKGIGRNDIIRAFVVKAQSEPLGALAVYSAWQYPQPVKPHVSIMLDRPFQTIPKATVSVARTTVNELKNETDLLLQKTDVLLKYAPVKPTP
ncbi:MAG: hypothetical protein AAB393_15435, partial [Bacteroidota bacterium]